VYKIEFSSAVVDDLKSLGAPERSQILDEVEVQLLHEPGRETRNRKILVALVPPWEHVPPVWQLRIGEYRVFYDIDEKAKLVLVRALRHKPPHKTTEEIL
jgi:mRNA-degrading endonuclease RelE of RelBE toxin-antitoxin system